MKNYLCLAIAEKAVHLQTKKSHVETGHVHVLGLYIGMSSKIFY